MAFVGRADECTDFVQMLSPEFEPIRVRLVYGVMQGSAAAQTFVRDSMMPNLRAFIERAIKVRRLPIPLEVTANAFNDDGSSWFRCGSSATRMPAPQIYYDDTDLAVVVSMIADCNGLFMAASPCGSDACGRPTVAGVSMCAGHVEQALRSPADKDIAIAALLHEMVHVLGFTDTLFDGFRDRETMELRDPVRTPAVRYQCEEHDGRFVVRWDVHGEEAALSYKYHFPGSIVKAIDARGLLARDCRCPIDPTRVYTNEDIEYCLRHPNHCAIAVTSPAVQREAREYYGCPTLEGQELENAVPSCQWLIQSHWKVRTLKGELMNWIVTEPTIFISPMTLALLEDSGWYEIDYSVATAQVASGLFGYKAGCEFATGKCITAGRSVDDRAFCLPNQHGRQTCSHDALRPTDCDTATWPHVSVWGRIAPQTPRSFLPAYSYGIPRNPALFSVDFCPVMQAISGSTCVFQDANARCIETQDRRAVCAPMHCAEDKSRYEVVGVGVCAREGQRLPIVRGQLGALRPSQVECRDPAVVCADWNKVHLLPDSRQRSIPKALGDAYIVPRGPPAPAVPVVIVPAVNDNPSVHVPSGHGLPLPPASLVPVSGHVAPVVSESGHSASVLSKGGVPEPSGIVGARGAPALKNSAADRITFIAPAIILSLIMLN